MFLTISATVYEFTVNIPLLVLLLISSVLLSIEAIRFLKRSHSYSEFSMTPPKRKAKWGLFLIILLFANMFIAVANKNEALNISLSEFENTVKAIILITSIVMLVIIVMNNLMEFLIWLFSITATYWAYVFTSSLTIYLIAFLVGFLVSVIMFTKVWTKKYVHI